MIYNEKIANRFHIVTVTFIFRSCGVFDIYTLPIIIVFVVFVVLVVPVPVQFLFTFTFCWVYGTVSVDRA